MSFLVAQVAFDNEQEARNAIKELSYSIGPTLGKFRLNKTKSGDGYSYVVSVEAQREEIAKAAQYYLKGFQARARYDHV